MTRRFAVLLLLLVALVSQCGLSTATPAVRSRARRRFVPGMNMPTTSSTSTSTSTSTSASTDVFVKNADVSIDGGDDVSGGPAEAKVRGRRHTRVFAGMAGENRTATCVRSSQKTLIGGLELPGAVVAKSYRISMDLPDPNAKADGGGDDDEMLRSKDSKNSKDGPGFSGKIAVVLEAVELTTCFMVHSVGLNVTEMNAGVKVTVNGTEYAVKVTREEENMWDVFEIVDGAFKAGDEIKFTLGYAGKASESIPDGLYLGPNAVGSIDAGKMFATHMQYLHAREVFPCLDEPSRKALWSSEVSIPADLARPNTRVMFNTHSPKVSSEAGRKRFEFKQTKVPIAPYLVAFAVGDFATKSTVATDGLKHTIAGPAGSEAYLEYALAASPAIVRALESYLGASEGGYKLSSMTEEIVHLASGLAGGAMENLGLIIYGNNNLLLPAGETSLMRRQRVSVVMAHELSHMWFGDLVTTSSWRQLFLNEGMAEFLQYIAISETNPDWNLWTSYKGEGYLADMMAAMRLDYAGSTSPIIISKNATGNNNPITYYKGAVVNKFASANAFAANNAFKYGMRSYLEENAKGNAVLSDWFDAIDRATDATEDSGNTAEAVLGDWLKNRGFPVITISDRDPETGNITVTQEPVAKDTDPDASEAWYVRMKTTVVSEDKDGKATSDDYTAVITPAEGSTVIAPRAAGEKIAVYPDLVSSGFYGLVRYESDEAWAAAMDRYASVETATQAERMVFLNGAVMLVETSFDKINILSEVTKHMTKLAIDPFEPTPSKGALTKAEAIDVIKVILDAWGPISRALSANKTLIAEATDGVKALVEPAASDIGWGTPLPSPSPVPSPSPSPSNGTNGTHPNGTAAADLSMWANRKAEAGNDEEASVSAARIARRAWKRRRAIIRGAPSQDLTVDAAPRPAASDVSEHDEREARNVEDVFSSSSSSSTTTTTTTTTTVSAAERSANFREAVSMYAGDAVATGSRKARHAFVGRQLLGAEEEEDDDVASYSDLLSEADEDSAARSSVMFWAVYFSIGDYAKEAAHVFKIYREENRTIHADILAAVTWGAARVGSAEDVDSLFEDFEASKGTSSEFAYAMGVGAVKEDQCDKAVKVLGTYNETSEDRGLLALEYLGNSIRMNGDCSGAMWTRFKEVVSTYWAGATESEVWRTPLLSDTFIGAFASEDAYLDLRTFLKAEDEKGNLPVGFTDTVLARVLLGVNVLRTNSNESPYVPPSATPTPGASPSPEDGKKSKNEVIYIVAGVAGGLAVLGGIGYFAMRKRTHEAVPGFESPLVRDSRSSYT